MDYQIGDFIIRIKNASLAKRRKIEVPYSGVNKAIGRILHKEGFLSEIKEVEKDGRKTLSLEVSYQKRNPVLNDVKIISKPSLRVYLKAKRLPRSHRGLGVYIVSTSQGIMTEKEARKKGIGGEVLFRIW